MSRGIGVAGLWWRDRRVLAAGPAGPAGARLDGPLVNDGALTNPFAHAVALAVAAATGSGGDQPIGGVELDTYRTRAAGGARHRQRSHPDRPRHRGHGRGDALRAGAGRADRAPCTAAAAPPCCTTRRTG